MSSTSSVFRFRFFMLLLCLAGFAGIALWVQGKLPKFDITLLTTLRSPTSSADPIGPQWLEEGMRDITALGSNWVLLLAALCSSILLWLNQHRKLALALVVGIGAGLAVTFALKHGFARPRPTLVVHETQVFTSSFPSAHAMMSVITLFSLALIFSASPQGLARRRYIMLVASMITFCIGFSRVYLGVHWPTDVIAGWLAGVVWVILWWSVVSRLIPDRA
ncbi:phosphatase PAP2 family protein [Salinimonas lutimaris]|uniref:phosphatase PAP2 family protein n=1 Tax=Salinimonas lutimaris TaxID=914153 RepID=UPI0010BFEEC9|nr:phosphatase PAP2 family protein [Salinimonas lutimaris]